MRPGVQASQPSMKSRIVYVWNNTQESFWITHVHNAFLLLEVNRGSAHVHTMIGLNVGNGLIHAASLTSCKQKD